MSTDAPKQKGLVTNRIILLGAILTLGNLAEIIHKSSRVYLFQQALCLLYYKRSDPTKIQSDFSIDENFCKVSPVQSRLATIDGIDSFLSLLPPLLVLATYKELVPRVGLRWLIILSLFCSGLEVLYSIAVFWLHQDWATPAALLSFTFNLVGGGSITRITVVCKYVADISPPEELTNSFNYMSAFYFLAEVGGSWIGSLLLSQHIYLLNGLSIACFALTTYVSGAIPSHCGYEEQHEYPEPIISNLEDEYHDTRQPLLAESIILSHEFNPKHRLSLLGILLRSWHASYQSLVNLFSTSFPTSTILLIYFLNCLAIKVEVLLPQYTSLILSWPLATVNAAMALKGLVSALFLFILPTLRRSYLEPRMSVQQVDLLVVQILSVVNTLGVIGLGISAPAWFFILSLCVYTSGMGLGDSLLSYGTLTLPVGEEVAEFYLRTGLISTIAFLTAGPLWSVLFSMVLRSGVLPLGLPFWVCAGLFGAGTAAVMALKRRLAG